MAQTATDRRNALRDNLILIAEKRISDTGLDSLRARDLASEAGCAVGAIYNVFGDLTDLVLAVNARTFDRLGSTVAASLTNAPDDPTGQLVIIARAYHHFAAENHNVWRALFDVERAAGQTAPDWYLAEMGRLFHWIDRPITALFPTMALPDRALLTRALFSAVHGIVLLGLDQASAGVPGDQIDRMIDLILRQITQSEKS